MKTKLKEKYNNFFYVPPEAKLEISKKNVKACKIAIFFFLALGVVCLVSELIAVNHSSRIVNIVYYSSFIAISLAFLLISRARKNEDSYLKNQALIILTCTFICCLMYFNIADEVSAEYVVGFYCAIVIMIIAFELTPYFYVLSIAIFFFETLFLGKATTDYDPVFYFDNGLFCLSLIFFSFFKRKLISVRELNKLEIWEKEQKLNEMNDELAYQNESLLLSKEYLEDTVFNQTHELQLQKNKLIRIQDRTIIGLSNLAENRYDNMGNHVLRIRDYVRLLSEKALQSGDYPELDDHVVSLYAKAAPLHDIGKITVPDAVLKKPGKLTPEEFELLKSHTTKGSKIVEDVLGRDEDAEYIRIAKEMATYHHEKYNGTGYPEGLKGEAIPLSARIATVAVVFDALVTPRVYKNPVPLEEAFTVIENEAGKQLDPKLARLFLDARKEVTDIFKQYQDWYSSPL